MRDRTIPLGALLLLGVALWIATSGSRVPGEAPLGSPPPPVTGVGAWLGVAAVGSARPAWCGESALRFDRLAGKVVLLEFWATWCPPCRRSLPDLNALAREHRAQGLRVVGITAPDRNQSLETIATVVQREVTHPVAVLRTPATLQAYGVSVIPYAVLVGRRGRVVWKGNPYAEEDALEAAVKAALAASPPRGLTPWARPSRR